MLSLRRIESEGKEVVFRKLFFVLQLMVIYGIEQLDIQVREQEISEEIYEKF